MTESILETRGVKICAESFGVAKNPPLLLIMGAGASMLWWPREFCQMLASAGFFVIRYDNRDTGRSTSYKPGTVPYTIDDMAEDAAAVLDHYDLPSAHVVGASLGGMIAQLLALKQPGRMRTMTLLMSGPVPARRERSREVNWQNEEAAVNFIVDGWRAAAGTRHPFDETLIRNLAREDYHRSPSLLSLFNHELLTGGEWAAGELGQIKVPTLIIGGQADPALPFAAKVFPLDNAGHEIHRLDWPLIIREIERFTKGAGSTDDALRPF